MCLRVSILFLNKFKFSMKNETRTKKKMTKIKSPDNTCGGGGGGGGDEEEMEEEQKKKE